MAGFQGALRVLNEMKTAGAIEEYAVAGAMALAFWIEPVPTYDLDVLVFLPASEGPLVSLRPIYDWTSAHGYAEKDEHVLIDGVPVQFLPSHDELADEAVRTAETLDYLGVSVRVVRPEYLAALYLEPSARTTKRRERVAALLESPRLDRQRLDALLRRFHREL